MIFGGAGDSDVVFLKGSEEDYTYTGLIGSDGSSAVLVEHEIYGSDTIGGDVEYGLFEEGDAFLWIMA